MMQLKITCPYCRCDASQYGADGMIVGDTVGRKTIHATEICPGCGKEIHLYFELTKRSVIN